MRKLASLIGIALSAVAILLGILILTGAILNFNGDTAIDSAFGTSFYTYSYRATRYAANNVDALGEFAQGALGLVMLFAGAAGVLLSLYGLGAAQESEQKRTLLMALIQKQTHLANVAENACQKAEERLAAAQEPQAEEQAE